MTKTLPSYHDRLIFLATGAAMALVVAHCHPLRTPTTTTPAPCYHK